MKIAFTTAPGKGDVDLLLFGLAQDLKARGLRPAGVVQVNTCREGDGPCDMDVQILPDGPMIRISQSLGANARGCRLDPGALEQAVSLVQADLVQADLAETDVSQRPDVLLINKFGKHEADGRGFRDAISTAVERDIPIIVGVNGLNRERFVEFSGDAAIEVAPKPEALTAWVVQAIADAQN